MKIGIISNFLKDEDLNFTKSIINFIEENGKEVLINELMSIKLNRADLRCNTKDLYNKSDIILVLGGDGTLLNIARQTMMHDTPILGVNLGHLGFLTDIEFDEVYESLKKIFNNQYTIEERMMLEAQVIRGNLSIENFYALNDIGITRGYLSRIVYIKAVVDDDFIDIYPGDGVIVSTPTGSTAYSLSAGGPIIPPNVNVMLLTPICPHTLHSRSIVLSDKSVIKIEMVYPHQEVMLTIDGQQGYKLCYEDIILIKKSDYTTKLIKVSDRSFFKNLRVKLVGRMKIEDMKEGVDYEGI